MKKYKYIKPWFIILSYHSIYNWKTLHKTPFFGKKKKTQLLLSNSKYPRRNASFGLIIDSYKKMFGWGEISPMKLWTPITNTTLLVLYCNCNWTILFFYWKVLFWSNWKVLFWSWFFVNIAYPLCGGWQLKHVIPYFII